MAVALWNRGGDSVLQTMRNMDIEPGMFTINYVNHLDANHGQKPVWHGKEKTKIARKVKRQVKKRKIDNTQQKEGITYEAGAF